MHASKPTHAVPTLDLATPNKRVRDRSVARPEPRDANLVVLSGVVAVAPVHVETKDGLVTTFEVRTTGPGGRVRQLPVRIAAVDETIVEHLAVGVIGTLNRRFFRSAGRTANRTEVVADRIVLLATAGGRSRFRKAVLSRVEEL